MSEAVKARVVELLESVWADRRPYALATSEHLDGLALAVSHGDVSVRVDMVTAPFVLPHYELDEHDNMVPAVHRKEDGSPKLHSTTGQPVMRATQYVHTKCLYFDVPALPAREPTPDELAQLCGSIRAALTPGVALLEGIRTFDLRVFPLHASVTEQIMRRRRDHVRAVANEDHDAKREHELALRDLEEQRRQIVAPHLADLDAAHAKVDNNEIPRRGGVFTVVWRRPA